MPTEFRRSGSLSDCTRISIDAATPPAAPTRDRVSADTPTEFDAIVPGDTARLVCPRCGTRIPGGWPAPQCNSCLGCRIPLGRHAVTSAIVEIGRKVSPILGIGTILVGAGLVLLVGSMAVGAPVLAVLRGPTIPAWALLDILGAVSLFVAGGVASAGGSWIGRRELQRIGIDSPAARRAARAFFPRYSASRLIRAGRLNPEEPVVPYRASSAAISP